MTEDEQADTQQAADGRLSVTSTVTDGTFVLALAGEIDNDTGEALRQLLDITVPGAHVVVDLQRVTFLDSSGINVFLAAHDALARTGGWLRLAGPPETVERVLQIVGVDTVIDCRPTLSQALSH